jgi:uncharacterized lipoprotein NlpE involved in copper resistance
MFKKYSVVIASVVIGIAGCNDKQEDVTDSVNKAGSVETSVHINHLDSVNDELVTVHKIWVKNNVFKTAEYRDTLPSLGLENTEVENEEGDTKNVRVKKDYEIYITVK